MYTIISIITAVIANDYEKIRNLHNNTELLIQEPINYNELT